MLGKSYITPLTQVAWHNFSKMIIACEVATLQNYSPVNLSFQVALGTLLKVITPLTVSFRLNQVVSKSTLLGLRDIL